MGYRDMNPLCIVSRPDLNRTRTEIVRPPVPNPSAKEALINFPHKEEPIDDCPDTERPVPRGS